MTKSDEWDERNLPRGKLPFTPKVLIGVGILVILITLLIAFATPPAYASVNDCNSEFQMWFKHTQLLCWVVLIYEQNEQIIEKLDWNNCVLGIDSRYSYTSSLLILKACGEIP